MTVIFALVFVILQTITTTEGVNQTNFYWSTTKILLCKEIIRRNLLRVVDLQLFEIQRSKDFYLLNYLRNLLKQRHIDLYPLIRNISHHDKEAQTMMMMDVGSIVNTLLVDQNEFTFIKDTLIEEYVGDRIPVHKGKNVTVSKFCKFDFEVPEGINTTEQLKSSLWSYFKNSNLPFPSTLMKLIILNTKVHPKAEIWRENIVKACKNPPKSETWESAVSLCGKKASTLRSLSICVLKVVSYRTPNRKLNQLATSLLKLTEDTQGGGGGGGDDGDDDDDDEEEEEERENGEEISIRIHPDFMRSDVHKYSERTNPNEFTIELETSPPYEMIMLKPFERF